MGMRSNASFHEKDYKVSVNMVYCQKIANRVTNIGGWMDCLLTKDFSEFSKYVDVSKIPGLSGDGFSVDLSVPAESLLFLIKKSTDFSVAEALLSESQFDKGTKAEDIYALRDIYANEKRHGDKIADSFGNNSYKSMVSCMDDKTMTGILIFYPSVTVSKKEYMGPIEITGSLDYVLPFLQISNVSFHEDKVDASQGVSCGEIFLKEKPDNKHISMSNLVQGRR